MKWDAKLDSNAAGKRIWKAKMLPERKKKARKEKIKMIVVR